MNKNFNFSENNDDIMTSEFQKLIKKAKDLHGHICPPVLFGLRVGQKVRELFESVFKSQKDVLAIFETDACHADGVQIASGVTFGRGSIRLKMMGKMGITFFDPDTGEGYRFLLLRDHFEDIRKKLNDKVSYKKLAKWFSSLPEKELWIIRKIKINQEEIREPIVHESTFCDKCGEQVMVKESIKIETGRICKLCAGQRYYKEIE